MTSEKFIQVEWHIYRPRTDICILVPLLIPGTCEHVDNVLEPGINNEEKVRGAFLPTFVAAVLFALQGILNSLEQKGFCQSNL